MKTRSLKSVLVALFATVTVGLILSPRMVVACTSVSWCDTWCSYDCCAQNADGTHTCGPSMCTFQMEQSRQVRLSESATNLWRPLQAPPTFLRVLDERRVQIIVTGYVIEKMAGGGCVSALSPVPGIESVDSITLVESASGQAVEELNFQPNTNTGASFAEFWKQQGYGSTDSGSWQGFHTNVLGVMEGGAVGKIIIEVSIAPGLDLAALARSLGEHGYVGTGSALPDGSLEHHHELVRRLGSGEIRVMRE